MPEPTKFVYLALSPVLGPKDIQYVGPFNDLADATTARKARWPHLDVVVLRDTPKNVISYKQAAREQDARR
jgi:hypothetical protein